MEQGFQPGAGAALDIQVIICAYTLDRWDLLVSAVRSCEAQSQPPAGVIVVIDHNDELFDRARAAFTDHRVIANGNRPGLSGARNSGVAAATAAVVAFLDDDAEADVGWLAAFASHLADPTVGGTGGWVVPAWDAGAPAWFPAEFLWVVGCSYRGLPTSASEIRNPIGAAMAFRRELLDSVGGFPDGIGRVGTHPVGCEETALSIQVRRLGVRILLVPDAVVYHHVPASRTAWRYFWTRCLNEGRSKAIVARLTGRGDALSTERAYASRALPQGIARALADVARGPARGAALARAALIVAGLVITAIGYVDGSVRPRGSAG